MKKKNQTNIKNQAGVCWCYSSLAELGSDLLLFSQTHVHEMTLTLESTHE